MGSGVIGHRYVLDHDAFNNSIDENKCYCTRQPCMPDGIFDMGPCSTSKFSIDQIDISIISIRPHIIIGLKIIIYYCLAESPVVVSRAHFLYGDPLLLDTVEGLNPDPTKHELTWTIDPVSIYCKS